MSISISKYNYRWKCENHNVRKFIFVQWINELYNHRQRVRKCINIYRKSYVLSHFVTYSWRLVSCWHHRRFNFNLFNLMTRLLRWYYWMWWALQFDYDNESLMFTVLFDGDWRWKIIDEGYWLWQWNYKMSRWSCKYLVALVVIFFCILHWKSLLSKKDVLNLKG